MSLRSSPPWALWLGGLVGAGYGAVFAWTVSTNEYNAWGSLLWLPVIVVINVWLIRVVTRERGRWLAGLMLAAFVAKMLGSMARYLVAYLVYDRASDAERYNIYAAYNYQQWRAGHVDLLLSVGEGTHNMELLTTAIYAIVGPSPIVGFAAYACLAFWGAYLLYRAFCLAVPDGHHKRYAYLVFFLPSMIFWPSSIGKESWLLLFIGVTALGAARLFTRQGHSLWLLVIGAAGTVVIRPHMSVLLFGALLVAQLFRPTSRKGTDVLAKFAGLAVMGVAAVIFVRASLEMLGLDDLSFAAVSDGLDMAAGRTTVGGSEFEAVPITSPWSFVVATSTILFRPFLFEAHNAQMLIQALESTALLVLAIRWRASVRHAFGMLRNNPYVAFAFVYVAGFIVAFSGFSNFGIVARQRVLMLPFFLLLLALPDRPPTDPRIAARRRRGGRILTHAR